MSLFARMITVLTSVGLLSGGFLATVGLLTKERIALNKQREIEEAIVSVIPGTQSSEKLHEEDNFSIFGGKDKAGRLLGFAIFTSGIGFQDKITFMLGTNPSVTKINSLVILEQKETPGLGAKIMDRGSFLQFWENKDCTQWLRLRKPPARSIENLLPSEINTITGATISSEAVLNTANVSLDKLKELIRQGKLSSGGSNAH